MKKLLIAGPDFGAEFGWVIARWQGHVRWLSAMFDQTVVLSHDYFPLYRDFAVRVPTIGVRNCAELKNVDITYVRPTNEVCDNPDAPQKFVRYGEPQGSDVPVVVVHARDDRRPVIGDRNWPREKWNALCALISAMGYNIIAIGHPKASMCPVKCVDMRGTHLQNAMNWLASAAACVGPSSGPMHLASMCGCPHVVWSESGMTWNLGGRVGSNRQRYESAWNPLNTPVEVVESEGWQPCVQTVIKAMDRLIERTGSSTTSPVNAEATTR